MTLDSVPLDSLQLEDIQRLVDNQVREGKTIEYKESLPGQPGDRKSFLASITSFANTIGGHLILGVREDGGLPVGICGVPCDDIDAEVRRFDALFRDGVAPRLSTVDIGSVAVDDDRIIFVFRVRRSWSVPHMVTAGGDDRFYTRNSAGKHPMDPNELRNVFMQSQSVTEQVRRFRLDRIATIDSREEGVCVRPTPITVLHAVPLETHLDHRRLDPSELVAAGARQLRGILVSHTDYRHNLDGIVTFGAPDESGLVRSYTQVFWNGAIESVDSHLLDPELRGTTIPSKTFEEKIIESTRVFLQLQRELDILGPVTLLLSLVGVKGYRMALPDRNFESESLPFDRNRLLFPEYVLDDLSTDPPEQLQSLLDLVWNAAGMARSPYRD